jgi:hypothetical protein
MSRPEDAPNPGSPAAVAAGCTCPVMDNARGKGARFNEAGEPLFWVTQGCPLHAPEDPLLRDAIDLLR